MMEMQIHNTFDSWMKSFAKKVSVLAEKNETSIVADGQSIVGHDFQERGTGNGGLGTSS